ncbi:High-affinity glucose transporter [Elsinoe australis]|uniref:High-affinity glucose transporter n=1 Tax=Elsinoe australis TaxID=40998 RepID=A0A2P7ZQC5_9PEZI|nr:High-affinity glucose transporter [Elsinoe australis]
MRLGPAQPYFGLKGKWLTFWVTVACATDMTLFGYDQGVFGGVIVTQDFLTTLDLEGPTKTSLLSTVTAIYDIGCFFGAILAVIVGDRFGRKKSVLLGTTIMSIGAILQITAYSVPHMIVGRIIAGIGNGLNTATAPVWQGETSKASWRGKLIVIEMIMNIAGFSLSNWCTYGFSFVAGPAAWRAPLALQFIFIFILFGTVPWLPESPRWLIWKGRNEEAEQILADLESTDVYDPFIITQSKEIQFAVDYEKENSNVTSYYLPTVLIESVGLDNSTARLLAACNSVSYLAFSLFGIPNVEKWGRRKMMMYAAAGQCFCYLIITVCIRYTVLEGYAHQREVAKASIAFFFLYYVFFGIGWQGVPWLYPTEINSLAMRAKGAALGTATNWIFNFMVVEITPPGIQSLGWRFYIIWTIFNGAFVPIVYFFYPETAARSLEDLDRYFRGQPSIFVFRDKTVTSSKRPDAYIEHEQSEVRRHSSIASADVQKATANFRSEKLERVRSGETDGPDGDVDVERKEVGDLEKRS